MSEPIKPALTPEEWAEELDDWGGDRTSMPPYPPDEKEEYYDTPRHLAALCLYKQPFGFTRGDVTTLRDAAAELEVLGSKEWPGIAILRSTADRIASLLPPE